MSSIFTRWIDVYIYNICMLWPLNCRHSNALEFCFFLNDSVCLCSVHVYFISSSWSWPSWHDEEYSKVRFNLLPANSRIVSVRKHATICAWIDMDTVGDFRAAFHACFKSCCYTTTDDMNKIAFAFELRWCEELQSSPSLSVSVYSRGQNWCFCSFQLLLCICWPPLKPRRQCLCDGRFYFVIIRCFRLWNGRKKSKARVCI